MSWCSQKKANKLQFSTSQAAGLKSPIWESFSVQSFRLICLKKRSCKMESYSHAEVRANEPNTSLHLCVKEVCDYLGVLHLPHSFTLNLKPPPFVPLHLFFIFSILSSLPPPPLFLLLLSRSLSFLFIAHPEGQEHEQKDQSHSCWIQSQETSLSVQTDTGSV